MLFPSGWALQKPQQTIDPKTFEAMWRQGRLRVLPKRNGHRGHVITNGADTKVYSRNGTVDLTDRLPHIAAYYAKVARGYLIDGELHTPEEGTESFQKAMNTRTDDVVLSAFDMLHIDGSLTNEQYDARFNLMQHMHQMAGSGCATTIDDLPLGTNASYDDVLARIEREGIEGIVAWDRNAGHALNTNGNTKRGSSWKIKIRQTEDLVVTMAHACADPNLGCGSLQLSRQILPGMPLEPVGKVGSFELGFDRVAAMSEKAPYVVEVSHYGEDERGNLQFAKIVRKREDLHHDFGIAA